jgi:hypothetical protein
MLSGYLVSNIVLLIYNGHYETTYCYEWFVYFKLSSSALGGSILAPLHIYWGELTIRVSDGVENKLTNIEILLKINLHQINLYAPSSGLCHMTYQCHWWQWRAHFPMKEARQAYTLIFQYKYIALGSICADFFLRILIIRWNVVE